MALNLKKLNLKKVATPLLAGCLLMPSINAMASAANPFDDSQPSALAMYTDLIVIRPIGVVATVVGSVAYVLALPFTLPAGGANEAGKVLVVEPAVYTFVRCLGCTRPGYNKDSAEEHEKTTEAKYD